MSGRAASRGIEYAAGAPRDSRTRDTDEPAPRHRSQGRDPHDPRLPEARHPLPRHHHAARRRAAPSAARSTNWCIPMPGKIDKVAGIEARGFILGGAVAHQLSRRLRADPQEGQAAARDRAHRLFASNTASTRWRCTPTPSRQGERVVLVDDLIATGGTADRGRRSSCARSAPTSSPPASSSTCPTSAAPTSCAPSASRCAR